MKVSCSALTVAAILAASTPAMATESFTNDVQALGGWNIPDGNGFGHCKDNGQGSIKPVDCEESVQGSVPLPSTVFLIGLGFFVAGLFVKERR